MLRRLLRFVREVGYTRISMSITIVFAMHGASATSARQW